LLPKSTLPPELGLLKFPRTRHLANFGSATRDDLILNIDDVNTNWLNQPVFIEEKIDGANMGISIRNHTLVAQNRSHYVTSTYHPQFKFLDKWIAKHSDELWQVLQSERYILYGEWVYATHSIVYSKLPDWFIAFDMYDRLEQRFFSRQRLTALLQNTSIVMIPLVHPSHLPSKAPLKKLPKASHNLDDTKQKVSIRDNEDINDSDSECLPVFLQSVEQLRELVYSTTSRFIQCEGGIGKVSKKEKENEQKKHDERAEGVYIRRMSSDKMWLLDRAKVVRGDFLSGERWERQGVKPNQLHIIQEHTL
jgi:hypothetical protein